MNPTLTYDARRGIGTIQFASHKTKLHGTRQFCERWLAAFLTQLDLDLDQRLRSGWEPARAKLERDKNLASGLMHR